MTVAVHFVLVVRRLIVALTSEARVTVERSEQEALRLHVGC